MSPANYQGEKINGECGEKTSDEKYEAIIATFNDEAQVLFQDPRISLTKARVPTDHGGIFCKLNYNFRQQQTSYPFNATTSHSEKKTGLCFTTQVAKQEKFQIRLTVD